MEGDHVCIAIFTNKIELTIGDLTTAIDAMYDANRSEQWGADPMREVYLYKATNGVVRIELDGVWAPSKVATRSEGGSVWRPRGPKGKMDGDR